MLAAKCAVFAVVVFLIGELVAFASFFIGNYSAGFGAVPLEGEGRR